MCFVRSQLQYAVREVKWEMDHWILTNNECNLMQCNAYCYGRSYDYLEVALT